MVSSFVYDRASVSVCYVCACVCGSARVCSCSTMQVCQCVMCMFVSADLCVSVLVYTSYTSQTMWSSFGLSFSSGMRGTIVLTDPVIHSREVCEGLATRLRNRWRNRLTIVSF